MPTYDQYIAEWNTKQVTKYGAECVALVAEYEAENNLPIVWGDASAWVNNPVMLTHYNWIQNDPNDANQVPTRGEIIVWGPDLPYTNGAGHIAFFERPIDNQHFMSWGQNSGGAQAHFQEHSWAHVAGWYQPKQLTPPPAPESPYTITLVDPYKVDVIAGHQKWDLSHPDFASVAANPVLTLNQQTTITVAAELHHKHIADFVYLLEDPNVPQGYNRLDTVPYVPPAPVSNIKDFQPLTPTLATKVTIVTDVPYYSTSTNAQNAYKEAGRLPAGQYYQITKDFGMLNLSTDNTKDLQHWVNPRDNTLPEPAPAPKAVPVPPPQPFMPQLSDADKATFSAFNADRSPVKFVMEDNYNFRDLNGYSKKTVLRKTYDEVDMSGTFYHEGREWTRVHVTDTNGGLDINRWFAIPTINSVNHTPYIIPYDKMYSTQKTAMEQVVYNPNTPYTKFIQFGATVDVLYDKAIKTIDGIFRTKHK